MEMEKRKEPFLAQIAMVTELNIRNVFVAMAPEARFSTVM